MDSSRFLNILNSITANQTSKTNNARLTRKRVQMQIWDLTAGKIAGSIAGHKGGISALDFHPNEFLLASGAADGCVKFWDLETFKQVSSTEADSRAPIVGASFTPDGRALLVATKDKLRVSLCTLFTIAPACLSNRFCICF